MLDSIKKEIVCNTALYSRHTCTELYVLRKGGEGDLEYDGRTALREWKERREDNGKQSKRQKKLDTADREHREGSEKRKEQMTVTMANLNPVDRDN